MEKFQWIKNYLNNNDKNNLNSIADIIPNLFDEYLLIYWKIGIIENFPFEEYPLKNETIDQINKRIKIEKDFGLFFNYDENIYFKEVSLNYISKKFKKELDYKILDNIIEIPAIKILEKESIESLYLSLNKITKNESLNLFIEDSYRFPTPNSLKNEHIGINIKEYLQIQEDLNFDYFTYLFPDDLNWCLITSEDFPMFLCIKKHLIEEVKSSFELELFKINYNRQLY